MRLWRWLRRRYGSHLHVALSPEVSKSVCVQCSRSMWKRGHGEASCWILLPDAVLEFEEGYRDDPGRSLDTDR